VVDDDLKMAGVTAEILRRDGHAVEVVNSALEALRQVRAAAPDLMVLDFDMPDMDGAEVLDELSREAGTPPFPVVILTGARLAAGDQVLGLDRGAADYVLKGTDRHVLLARVRRALRDRGRARPLRCGRLVIDLAAERVQLEGRVIPLQRRPLHVLYRLASQPGAVISRGELLRLEWGTDYRGFEHSVSQAVYAIRRALGDAAWIETVQGSGYRFTQQP
ncbi:MAG: response regulator transcription factor, partial [Chloroflexota bacterium]|nr:response regulator transcription factor [Chloroflexota bacterium]